MVATRGWTCPPSQITGALSLRRPLLFQSPFFLKAQAHSSATSAHRLIATRCQHFRFDRVKTRHNKRLASSTSPPLCVRPLPTTFSFFSSPPPPPRCAWLISLSSFIHHHQNSVSNSFRCKCWTYSVKVTSIHCAQRLRVSNSRPVPAWVTSPHAAVQGNARKVFSSPQKIWRPAS